jgi:outer membrane protein TolC
MGLVILRYLAPARAAGRPRVHLRGVLAGLAALALVAGTRPGPAVGATLTLADAVSRALDDGPEARIARLEADQADRVASGARGAFWPHLRVTSRAGYSNRQDDKLVAVDGQGVVREYGLATLGSDRGWLNVFVDQILFDLSGWRRIERTELEAEAARVAEASQRETISFETLERYTEVLRLERLYALDEQRLAEARWLDAQAEELFKAGRSLPAEREQAVLNLEEARIDGELRMQALADARRSLWQAIGASDAEGGALRLVPDSVPVPAAVEGDPAADDALASTPELRVLALRRRMEEISLAAVRAERLPTLGVRTGYSNYGTKRFDNFTDELYVGVNFDLPIFDGFRTKASIDAQAKATEIARLRYDAMLETKRVRVRELVRRLAMALRRPELAERRAGVAHELARLANLNLQAQRGTLDAALAASAAATADGRAVVDAEVERVVVWARLQRETGRLAATVTGAPAAPGPAGGP